MVFKADNNKMLVTIANREDPDQTLICLCAVCLCLFGREVVFKILDHLPYSLNLYHAPNLQKEWKQTKVYGDGTKQR